MRLIDADALIKELEKDYESLMSEVKDANENPYNYTSKFIPATAGRMDGIVDAEIVINNAPTIEPDGDIISRQDAIDCVRLGDSVTKVIDRIKSLPSAETSTASEKHQLLEETSTNTSTDLISRQDVIELVKKSYYDLSDGEEDMWAMVHDVEQLPSAPSAEAEQVAGKLKNPDDSLLTDDSEACKEQKSKLDLISRQAAIECVGWGDSVTAVISRIKLLPNVQPDQQRGEWIEVEVFPEVYDVYGVKTWGSEMQCDQCGFRHTAIEGHMTQYNFCPSCGARMYKGGEDE